MPPVPTSKPPKSGTILDSEGLRAACESAIAEARLTLDETAALIAERVPERDKPPSRSAVSGARRETGSKVAALQLDIIRALTGASLEGPLYRVG